MSSYNYSYNVLINRFEAFAAGHLLIKRFTHGQIDLSDQLNDDQYPFMHVTPDTIEPVKGAMQFGFHVMFADIPRDKEYKAEYQREVISDCVRLGQDLIAEIQNGLELFGFNVQLVNDVVFEPFMEEQKNTVTGVAFTVKLEVPWDWSACDIPAIWAVGGTSTGGSGTPIGILLQVNNVDNVVQSQLDLVAGDNVTLTDNGDGSVTIDATGGAIAFYTALEYNTNHTTAQGNPYLIGDTVWYSGNVYRCIANNDAIIPTNASYWTLLGSGFRIRQNIIDWNATTGDYQIINKPTIPAAQVNSDWNAVSGVAEILNKPTIPAAQVNSDWNAVGGVAEILNKPTIPSPQGLQDVITVDNNLSVNNNIVGNGTDLFFNGNKNFEILPTISFRAAVGKYPPSYSELYVESIYAQLMSQGATIQKVKVDTTNVYVQTPAVAAATATAGQVLTLTNATTGAVEYQTPASTGIKHGTASGTDTYTVSITGVTSYVDGDAYLVRFPNGNTTSCTLNINSLGAIPLYRNNDGQLIGGDIWAGAEMLCIYNSTLNVFQCIGTSPNSLFAYVTNAETSTTITKGQPVYAFGGTGDRLTVKLAYNTSDATSAQTVGIVVTSSIAPNQKGIIIVAGQLDNLNTLPTSTFADGDALYLGATPGSITKVKPFAPNHLVYLGFVTTASPGNAGRMYVRVQNGYELDELHNVVATTPANNDYLYYDSSTSLYRLRQLTASHITNATTVGQNLVTLANPSAVRYLRINASNGIDTLSLAQLKTDLGLGTAVVGTNQTNVGITFEDVTGLSFAVTANKTYKWRATISYSVSTGLIMFSSNGPATSLNNARFTMGSSATANAVSNQAAYDQGTNVAVTNNALATADGIFRVTASGTWTIRFRCSVAASLTVRAGSIIEFEEVL